MHPSILVLIQFLKAVYAVFDNRDVEALDRLIDAYRHSDVDSLAAYVNGLSESYESIKNSLIYHDISNGPLEASNNTTKAIHRRSRGRAGTFLLNAYVILRE